MKNVICIRQPSRFWVQQNLQDYHIEEIISFLEGELEEVDVVVMPDFFLDRLISLDYDVRTFSEKLKQITERKGGSIDGI
jgi:hypothetical protein